MEVDHIIPRRDIKTGGKDEYSNLQLLHISCHMDKTAKDRKKYKLQEPDEVKVSRPDLKTRGG